MSWTYVCVLVSKDDTIVHLSFQKYYPPDFDPSKIPKLKLPKNRQYSIRIMAPFNMR